MQTFEGRREVGWRPAFSLYIVVFAILIAGPTVAAIAFGPQSPQYYILLMVSLPVALFRVVQAYPRIALSISYLIAFAFLPPLLAGLQWLFSAPTLGLEPPNLFLAAGISATVLIAAFGALLSDEDFRSAMHIVALVSLGYCVYGLTVRPEALNEEVARFQVAGVTTGVWGEIAFSAVVAAIASRRWHLILASLCLAFPVAILGELRGITIASAMGVMIFVLSRMPRHVGVYLLLLTIPAFVLSQAYWDDIGQFVGDALKLNDRTRGINSGFSGRFDNWIVGFDLFVKSPLIGTSIGDPVVRYTHNGYILSFAELGVVGGIAFCCSLFAALAVAVQRKQWELVAVIAAYMLFIFSWPRYLNLSGAVLVGVAVAVRSLTYDARENEEEQDVEPRGRAPLYQRARMRHRYR